MEDKYERLKISNQLCFPLYAASKEIVKKYRPYLEELDLTYTQYIVLMVLWEKGTATVKEIGEALYLDSGTLTPVLKSLEKKGYLTRVRTASDERALDVSVTEEGKSLRDKAVSVPTEMSKCVHLTKEEAVELYRILYKLLGAWSDEEEEK